VKINTSKRTYMPEPGAPPPPSGGKENFLTKKFGPLPIAAYVVAGAALIGYLILRSRSGTSTSTTGASSALGLTGTNSTGATVDPNQNLIDSLNSLQAQIAGIGVAAQPAPASGTSGPAISAAGIYQSFNTWLAYFSNRPDLVGANSGALQGQYQKELADYQARVKAGTGTQVPGATQGFAGAGGAEAPQRILPEYMLRAPVHLDVEGTRRPPVLTSPR
jgi:hypothetical protein